MLVNEYRLEIQFKKVQNIRNINNIPTVGSRPLECKPAQNELYMVFNYKIINFPNIYTLGMLLYVI
jgi:hypothetical protein